MCQNNILFGNCKDEVVLITFIALTLPPLFIIHFRIQSLITKLYTFFPIITIKYPTFPYKF